MTWFKVDDTLATHPKARTAGLPAMGLWAVAGALASQHLTDGFVPEWYVKTWPQGAKLAARLVDAGLWQVVDGGWTFHQWAERQPTKAKVEEEREKTRARQQAWRDKHSDRHRDTDGSHIVRNGVTDGVTDGGVTPLVTGAPTRPDPTRPKEEEQGPRKRGSRITDDWLPSEPVRVALAQEFPYVDQRRELPRFIDYWANKPGKDGLKLDWDRTWRNWIRTAAERAPGGGNGRAKVDSLGFVIE